MLIHTRALWELSANIPKAIEMFHRKIDAIIRLKGHAPGECLRGRTLRDRKMDKPAATSAMMKKSEYWSICKENPPGKACS